jgi:glycine C-acetyltransferase
VRSIAGTMDLHLELERRVAAFKQSEAAITFQSGFCANRGTIRHWSANASDLLGRAQSRQHHRRLPSFRRIIIRYDHCSPASLEQVIKEHEGTTKKR